MATERKVRRTQGTAPNGSSHLYDDVLSLASTLLRDRKKIGGRRLMELSESLRDLAQTLPELPNLASYVGTTADSLTDLADYISGSELETIMSDANQFSRRHPMMTMGIAAAAGLAAMTYFRSGSARLNRVGSKRTTSRSTGRARKSIGASSTPKSANGVDRSAHA